MAIRKLVSKKVVRQKTLRHLAEKISVNNALGKSTTSEKKELKRVDHA